MLPPSTAFDFQKAAEGLPRVPPPCPRFGVCGGCQLQDISYPDQVLLKERRLQSLFASPAPSPARWLPPLTGPPLGYRTRLRFSVKRVPKKGGFLVGFHEKSKRYVVDMRECPILPDKVARLLTPLRDICGRLSQPRSIPQIAVSAAENQDAYVFRVMDPPTEEDLRILSEFEAVNRVRVYLQTGGYDTIAPLNHGAPFDLTYSLREQALTLHFRPHHFTQVNPFINNAMVRQALDLLAPRQGERGLDLFCGVGNFTFALARAGAFMTGVDSEGDQILTARLNAEVNHLTGRASFEARDLTQAEGVASLDFLGADFALLDPPRTGALEVCRALPEDGKLRVLYISCNPETLARDSEVLVKEKGFKLEALGLVDMFPQTVQAETMALFRLETA